MLVKSGQEVGERAEWMMICLQDVPAVRGFLEPVWATALRVNRDSWQTQALAISSGTFLISPGNANLPIGSGTIHGRRKLWPCHPWSITFLPLARREAESEGEVAGVSLTEEVKKTLGFLQFPDLCRAFL